MVTSRTGHPEPKKGRAGQEGWQGLGSSLHMLHSTDTMQGPQTATTSWVCDRGPGCVTPPCSVETDTLLGMWLMLMRSRSLSRMTQFPGPKCKVQET
jgi:hypothetical protein